MKVGRSLSFFAWALYDWANSAFSAIIQTFVFAAYFTTAVAADEATGTTQWGIAAGLAGILLAVGGPIFGAIADQGGRRREWLTFFTFLCVGATALLWFIRPDEAYAVPALGLVGLGILGAEFSFIFYNALLPELAPPERLGAWSGWGWGIGYVGGVASLLLALCLFVDDGAAWIPLDHSSAAHVRATFVLCAVWYLVFSLPLLAIMPHNTGQRPKWKTAVRGAFTQLAGTFHKLRDYRHIVRFLIARMFYIDGLTTLFAFGGIYAAGTFGMSQQEVLLFGIGLNVSAGIGAATFALVDDRIGAKRLILFALVGLFLASSMVLLARDATWFWIFGLLVGIFVGPVQASSRSYLARLAPPHLRNEAFGFFVFSGKATAFVGPFMISWLTYWSGSQRVAMSSILIFFAIGALLMLSLPDDKPVTA